ncbi:unnamed protein product [Sphenostylis stenocarpa]|uniref:Uncharacterized protein n=1 Tax=Sphenostylis stenocarpa TaxID=92480 RepID=A0AA86RTG7_9FABA|nr:unnamed protein product [Sphenostylis stenocarpa]
MSSATAPVESRTQFSPLAQDIEENQIEINDRRMVIEPSEESFDWEALVILLRLAIVGMLLIGFALYQTKLHEPKFDPIPPKFFLDSFHVPHIKVSDGEVSSTWDIALTISNVMNYSDINILKLEAKINYEENESLAVITPILPQYMLPRELFFLDKEESKKVHLQLNTTGWEENQPIVDDTVVQAIAQDLQRGFMRFSLHMMVTGEAGFGDGWVETFTMSPKCSNLEVKFVEGDQLGMTMTMVDHKPKECVGLIHWGPIEDA